MNHNVIIEMHETNEVRFPNLAERSRYAPGGLSFYFRSEEKLELGDVVEVGDDDDATFKIINIHLAHKGMGHPTGYIYLCTSYGYWANSPEHNSKFDLARFDGRSVALVTDKERLNGIRRASTYC